MKYPVILLILIITILASCKDNKYDIKLTQVDSLIASNLDSVAQSVIDSISPYNIKSPETQAYYNMLKVELAFRSGEVLPDDSMINISITKFKENGDKHKLAQSLYFKGRMQQKRGETKKAIRSLLEAGQTAEKTVDATLKAKIHTNLAFINKKIGEYEYARKHIERALKSIPLLDDNIIIADIYQQASDIMGDLKDTIKAISYMKKCIPLLKQVDATGRANIYSGLANIYNVEGDHERAAKYGLLALKQRPKPDTYYILSETFRQLGDTATADSLWNTALNTAGNTYKTMMLTEKMKEKMRHGEHEKASTIGNEIIMMRDSLAKKNQADSVIEIQATFDVAKNAADNLSTWKTHMAGIVITVIVIFVALSLAYFIKISKFNNKIDKASEALGSALKNNETLKKELEAKLRIIAEQRNDNKDLQKTVKRLTKQLKVTMTANTEIEEKSRLEIQQCIVEMYEMMDDAIVHNKSISRWSNDKVARFIGYCSCAIAELRNIFEKERETLTTQNKLMLILQHFNKSKEDICKIMAMGESAYRQAASRLNKKIKATEQEQGQAQ